MQLNSILDCIYPLSANEKELLRQNTEEVTFQKGMLLLQRHKIEKEIYFIKQGSVRAYASTAESEVTFWFGFEGSAVFSMNSYVNNEKSYEDIELLEETVFYKIHADVLQKLYQTNIEIANWGRKLAEKELIKSEERLISLQFKSAKERYLDLIKNHPYLLQRVALGHIASYLGITRVSLSRIRADIK
ncbi:Crp/Fnr family transcriptional regulator [Flavobacterium dauae]|uniref:Crp/Fnr family transcriptional regulator n=1 Tax=Flavobacterium dauae TaxID=1563479 RepID=UPI00101B3607|nr:Crp/Fnr family transcriptional regulator [Flavobacterium dauae]WLD23859.1 Crp/Fnr family transcriptional regulator [Flavobacterium dauae]